jgi:two-component system KDP operon response regulator KdpE
VIDTERRRVVQDDTEVHLRPIEWAVLRLLLEAPGEVVTQARIMEAVWGQVDEGRRASLHVAINSLRRRLEDAGVQSLLIVTVPGVGYRVQAASDRVRAAQSEPYRR